MPGTTVTVTGGVERPPMVRTPQIVALFERARTLAEALGIELTEAGTGGGSDGNFTAALGVPTLDGMGVVGGGAHAADEQVVISSLPERAAVLAAMLRSSEAWHPLTLSD
jgi:glutamate carboxypeptidase